MRLIVLIALLAVGFAGCADEAAAPESPSDLETRDVETGSDLGAISGVTVDQAIVPIADITLTLNDGTSTVSAADGTFVFEDLAPGTYFISATGEGYLATQTSQDVVAGEVSTPRIQLQADMTPQPYQATFEFKGHMVVSDFIGIYVVSSYVPNDLCDCIFQFTSDPGVKTVVIDTDYESSTTRVEPHDMYWDIYGGDGHDSSWIMSRDAFHSSGDNFGPEVTEWEVQISSGEQPDVEQSFQGFVTFWHVETAPSGWTFFE